MAAGARTGQERTQGMGSVIVGGVRTPVGRLPGARAGRNASGLGGAAVAHALERSGVRLGDVGPVAAPAAGR